MADDADSPGWLSERTGLTLLAAGAGVLAALIVLPYLQYILLGVVLAYVLLPAQRRLERLIGSMMTALTLVVVAVLAILLPTLYVLAIALRQAFDVINAIENDELDAADIEQQLESTGITVDLTQLVEANQEQLETILQGLATTGLEFVTGIPAILIGLTVTVFVLFALLHQGDRLVAWFQTVTPVDDAVFGELLAKLDQLMWASVVGNAAVAAIQAVLLGIGLALLGVPAVVFLTVATFVLSLLPLVGAFGVWVPVSAYLFAIGDVNSAIVLVVYGTLVSASDTYLRPALIGKTGAFNSAIIVVGIFGGIIVFGGVGLFIGPVVLGGAKVALDLHARERAADDDAVSADPPAATEGDSAVEPDPETGIRSDRDAAISQESAAGNPDSDDGESDTDRDPATEADADTNREPDTGDARADRDSRDDRSVSHSDGGSAASPEATPDTHDDDRSDS